MANNLKKTTKQEPSLEPHKIKALMPMIEMSGEELAAQLNLTPAAISQALNQRRQNPATITRIADALGERVRLGVKNGLLAKAA